MDFFDFKTLREMIVESLADKKYEAFLDDAKHVDAMLNFLGQLYEHALEDDWYKSARAEPDVFAQLSENELRVIDGIHLLLSKEYATSKAHVFHALLRQEVEKPKDRFELEKAKVEHIIGALQRFIKGGLNKDEFLKLTAYQEDRADIDLMFGDDVLPEKQSAEVKTITKVPVGAIALMGAAIYAVIGLIYGIIIAIGIGVGVSVFSSTIAAGAVGAVVAIIGGVVGGFVGGYIIVAIIALIYNWLAPRIGGIKLELD